MVTVSCLLLAGAFGNLAQQVEFGFQQDLSQHPALRLSGPNARQAARADGQGLRINLAADRSELAGVGVDSRFRVAGDFEITLDYDILAVDKVAPIEGAGVALLLRFETSGMGRASITRLRKGEQEVFGASRITPGADGRARYQTENVPATSPRGSLRLVRTGATLKYLVADGTGDFREIHTAEVGTEDVTELRAQGRTGGRPGHADVRLTRLSVRADELPDRPTIRATSRGRWSGRVWSLAAMLLLAVGGGTGFYFWKQRT